MYKLDEIAFEAITFNPKRIETASAWIGHTPFAYWLIKTLQPDIFVELGTHWGNSYFAFCQAVKELDLTTQCYAIDEWIGDVQAGEYGEEVYRDVEKYNISNYKQFSTLIRKQFSNAANEFECNTIDLLHIDGLHTYEAVKEDFLTWLPKMKQNGVVLFHDTNVYENNFGVWKFWEELIKIYPYNFDFKHSHGLGVLSLSDNKDSKVAKIKEYGDMYETLFKSLGKKQTLIFENKKLLTSYYNTKNTKIISIFNSDKSTEPKISLKKKFKKERFSIVSSTRYIIRSVLKQVIKTFCYLLFKKVRGFNKNDYLNKYSDVKNSYFDPYLHFAFHGINEGREPISSVNHKELETYRIIFLLLKKIYFLLGPSSAEMGVLNTDNNVIGYIDSPRENEEIGHDYFHVKGWCYYKGENVISGNVFIDSIKCPELLSVGLRRMDVTDALPFVKNSLLGFESFIYPDLLKDTHQLKIKLEFESGSTHILSTKICRNKDLEKITVSRALKKSFLFETINAQKY